MTTICPMCACAVPAGMRHVRNILTLGECVELPEVRTDG